MDNRDANYRQTTTTNFRQFNNKIEKFDGSGDYEIWWSDTCGYFEQFKNVSESDKVKVLYAAIVGNAKFVLESGGQTFATAAQIHEKMVRSFVSKISWFSKLSTTLQKPGESVDEFHVRLRVLVTRAFGHCGMEASEMDNYVRDLLRTNTLPEISAKLKISTHSTLQDTLYSAALYEQALNNGNTNDTIKEGPDNKTKENIQNQFKQLNERISALTKNNIAAIKGQEKSADTGDQESALNRLTAVISSMVKSNNESGHRQGIDKYQGERKKIECLHCHKIGHVYKNCFSASEGDKNKIREQQRLKWEALNSKGAATTSH